MSASDVSFVPNWEESFSEIGPFDEVNPSGSKKSKERKNKSPKKSRHESPKKSRKKPKQEATTETTKPKKKAKKKSRSVVPAGDVIVQQEEGESSIEFLVPSKASGKAPKSSSRHGKPPRQPLQQGAQPPPPPPPAYDPEHSTSTAMTEPITPLPSDRKSMNHRSSPAVSDIDATMDSIPEEYAPKKESSKKKKKDKKKSKKEKKKKKEKREKKKVPKKKRTATKISQRFGGNSQRSLRSCGSQHSRTSLGSFGSQRSLGSYESKHSMGELFEPLGLRQKKGSSMKRKLPKGSRVVPLVTMPEVEVEMVPLADSPESHSESKKIPSGSNSSTGLGSFMRSNNNNSSHHSGMMRRKSLGHYSTSSGGSIGSFGSRESFGSIGEQLRRSTKVTSPGLVMKGQRPSAFKPIQVAPKSPGSQAIASDYMAPIMTPTFKMMPKQEGLSLFSQHSKQSTHSNQSTTLFASQHSKQSTHSNPSYAAAALSDAETSEDKSQDKAPFAQEKDILRDIFPGMPQRQHSLDGTLSLDDEDDKDKTMKYFPSFSESSKRTDDSSPSVPSEKSKPQPTMPKKTVSSSWSTNASSIKAGSIKAGSIKGSSIKGSSFKATSDHGEKKFVPMTLYTSPLPTHPNKAVSSSWSSPLENSESSSSPATAKSLPMKMYAPPTRQTHPNKKVANAWSNPLEAASAPAATSSTPAKPGKSLLKPPSRAAVVASPAESDADDDEDSDIDDCPWENYTPAHLAVQQPQQQDSVSTSNYDDEISEITASFRTDGSISSRSRSRSPTASGHQLPMRRGTRPKSITPPSSPLPQTPQRTPSKLLGEDDYELSLEEREAEEALDLENTDHIKDIFHDSARSFSSSRGRSPRSPGSMMIRRGSNEREYNYRVRNRSRSRSTTRSKSPQAGPPRTPCRTPSPTTMNDNPIQRPVRTPSPTHDHIIPLRSPSALEKILSSEKYSSNDEHSKDTHSAEEGSLSLNDSKENEPIPSEIEKKRTFSPFNYRMRRSPTVPRFHTPPRIRFGEGQQDKLSPRARDQSPTQPQRCPDSDHSRGGSKDIDYDSGMPQLPSRNGVSNSNAPEKRDSHSKKHSDNMMDDRPELGEKAPSLSHSICDDADAAAGRRKKRGNKRPSPEANKKKFEESIEAQKAEEFGGWLELAPEPVASSNKRRSQSTGRVGALIKSFEALDGNSSQQRRRAPSPCILLKRPSNLKASASHPPPQRTPARRLSLDNRSNASDPVTTDDEDIDTEDDEQVDLNIDPPSSSRKRQNIPHHNLLKANQECMLEAAGVKLSPTKSPGKSRTKTPTKNIKYVKAKNDISPLSATRNSVDDNSGSKLGNKLDKNISRELSEHESVTTGTTWISDPSTAASKASRASSRASNVSKTKPIIRRIPEEHSLPGSSTKSSNSSGTKRRSETSSTNTTQITAQKLLDLEDDIRRGNNAKAKIKSKSLSSSSQSREQPASSQSLEEIRVSASSMPEAASPKQKSPKRRSRSAGKYGSRTSTSPKKKSPSFGGDGNEITALLNGLGHASPSTTPLRRRSRTPDKFRNSPHRHKTTFRDNNRSPISPRRGSPGSPRVTSPRSPRVTSPRSPRQQQVTSPRVSVRNRSRTPDKFKHSPRRTSRPAGRGHISPRTRTRTPDKFLGNNKRYQGNPTARSSKRSPTLSPRSPTQPRLTRTGKVAVRERSQTPDKFKPRQTSRGERRSSSYPKQRTAEHMASPPRHHSPRHGSPRHGSPRHGSPRHGSPRHMASPPRNMASPPRHHSPPTSSVASPRRGLGVEWKTAVSPTKDSPASPSRMQRVKMAAKGLVHKMTHPGQGNKYQLADEASDSIPTDKGVVMKPPLTSSPSSNGSPGSRAPPRNGRLTKARMKDRAFLANNRKEWGGEKAKLQRKRELEAKREQETRRIRKQAAHRRQVAEHRRRASLSSSDEFYSSEHLGVEESFSEDSDLHRSEELRPSNYGTTAAYGNKHHRHHKRRSQ